MNRLVACGIAAVSLCWIGRADAWEVRAMHPFVEATADQLPARLGPRCRGLLLRGLQNDWIHGGLAITVTGEERATVTVRGTMSQEEIAAARAAAAAAGTGGAVTPA